MNRDRRKVISTNIIINYYYTFCCPPSKLIYEKRATEQPKITAGKIPSPQQPYNQLLYNNHVTLNTDFRTFYYRQK